MISERLGHSKVACTLDQYVHLMPGMQEEASDKSEQAMNKAFDQVHPTNHVS